MSIRLFFCLCACTLMAACANGPRPSGATIESGERYSASLAGVEDYRLGAGDKVRITIFNEPTLSGEFAVSTTGTLSLPLAGDIPAQGKDTTQIAADVQKKLGDGYLRDPQVSVEVTAYRPFFILGEVKAPGQYPYASGLTALNAVATAQGFTPRSNRGTAYIRKADSTQEEAYKLTPDLRVLPGDTIRIGERYF